tara:strand:- start:3724 stop:3897 length:174 start_codon:yes stop_codon:yes gene_type:complete
MIKRPEQLRATMFLRNIPRGVKDHFKAYCARRGITMTEKIVQLMKETIAKDDRLEPK